MLNRKKHIPELWDLKHRKDSYANEPIEMEDKFLKKTLPPFLFNNFTMNEFLLRLEPLSFIMFNQISLIRNFKNFMVPKFYDKHID